MFSEGFVRTVSNEMVNGLVATGAGDSLRRKWALDATKEGNAFQRLPVSVADYSEVSVVERRGRGRCCGRSLRSRYVYGVSRSADTQEMQEKQPRMDDWERE